ncbi:hypothetical protein IAU60_002662 [Kwoniella sp. DSM 27419]
MDLVQNGESSRSPRINGAHDIQGDVEMVQASGTSGPRQSTLILPTWDVPPAKPLHTSQDLISLLHLDSLYNTYVRPFADVVQQGDEGDRKPVVDGGPGGKKGQQKRRKMEKGYLHLIEDCIDPIPTGSKPENVALLPLIPDFGLHPGGPPPPLFPDGIEVLPNEAFQVARLDPGTKQDGYANGVKVGVREAEEKRKKRRAAKMTVQLDHGAVPSPAGPGTALPSPGIPSAPGTPLLPVLPPTRPPFPVNTTRNVTPGMRPFPPPGQGQGQGGQQNSNGNRPYAPFKRPGSADVQPGQHKRAKSGSVGPTGSGPGSRSGSPMPQGGQGGQGGQRMKPGMRSKTEGV